MELPTLRQNKKALIRIYVNHIVSAHGPLSRNYAAPPLVSGTLVRSSRLVKETARFRHAIA